MALNTIKSRVNLLALFLFLFSYQTSFSQTEWKDVENFESFPSSWWAENRSSANHSDYTWTKLTSAGSGSAYNGSPTSAMMIGLAKDPTEGDVVSQWLITKRYLVTNGDKISFWTKSHTNSSGEDRLQVRLSTTGGSSIPLNPFMVGDFDILLGEINSGNAKGGYPSGWVKRTYEVQGLPTGQLVNTRFALRYYVPWLKNNPSPPPTGDEDSNSLVWQNTEAYLQQIGINIAFMILDEATGGLLEPAVLFVNWGINIFNFFSSLFGSSDRTSILIDGFEYDPTDIRLANHDGDVFLPQPGPNPVETLVKDFCVPGERVGDEIKTFTIFNYGSSYQVTNAQITGPDASDFQFFGSGPSGTLSQFPSRFQIRFNPAVTGNKQATVSFNTNHPNFPTVQFNIAGQVVGYNPPTLQCLSNPTVTLDANGQADLRELSLSPFFNHRPPSTLVNATVNLCGADDIFYRVYNVSDNSPANFDASDIGPHLVYVEQEDVRFGTFQRCTTTVIIKDNTPPVIPSNYQVPPATYNLHPDSSVLWTTDLIKPTAGSDNSGDVRGFLTWSGRIGGHGTYVLTWGFEDQSGNRAFGQWNQTINVVDVTPPVANCKDAVIGFRQPASTGDPSFAVVETSDVDSLSFDAASTDLQFGFWNGSQPAPAIGIANDPNISATISYPCSDEGTSKQVTMIVKDRITQQQATCQADVDIIPLNFDQCADKLIRVGNNPADNFRTSITIDDIYKGPGACLQQTTTLSKSVFDCSDVGVQDVIVTISRDNGQGGFDTTQCISEVHVIDFERADYLSYERDYFAEGSIYNFSDPYIDTIYPTFSGQDNASKIIRSPFRLRCSTPDWEFTIVGGPNNYLNHTQTVSGSATALTPELYPGTYNLNRYMLHPDTNLRFPDNRRFYVNLNSILIVLDTTPPPPVQFSNAVPRSLFGDINECGSLQEIDCPYLPYTYTSRVSPTPLGTWGFIMRGATIGTVENLGLGTDLSEMVELNAGITTFTFFAKDNSGNIADTLIWDHQLNLSGFPQADCMDDIRMTNDFANNQTITIESPYKENCGLEYTDYIWGYRVFSDNGVVAQAPLVWQPSTREWTGGISANQSTNIILSGSNDPDISDYRIYYYREDRKVFYNPGLINSGSCYTRINLVDQTPPDTYCPNDLSLVTDPGQCDITIEINNPLTAGNQYNDWYFSISGDANYTSPGTAYTTDKLFHALPPGNYTLTTYGRDNFGNVSSCSSSVSITDISEPVVSCPSNLNIQLPSGVCEVEMGTCGTTTAGWSGNYAPDRLQTINTLADGNINYSSAPSSILITDNDLGNGTIGFTATRIRVGCADTTFRFSWTYNPGTSPTAAIFNQPGYRIGNSEVTYFGTFDQNNTGVQTGTLTINATEGEVLDIGLVNANNGIKGASLSLSLTQAPDFQPNNPISVSELCDYTYYTNAYNRLSAGTHSFFHRFIDEYGNTKECVQQVNVIDNNPAVATCQNITVYLDRSGEARLSPEDVLSSCLSTLNDVDDTLFTCANIGFNSVLVTNINSLGQPATCLAQVTVVDTNKPFLVDQINPVFDLSIDPSTVLAASSIDLTSMADDNCGVQSVDIVNIDSIRCSNFGLNPVRLVITDVNGNVSDTLNAQINVQLDSFFVENPGEQRVCTGESATFTLNGTNVASYQWQWEKEDLEWENAASSWAINNINYSSFAKGKNLFDGSDVYYASANGTVVKETGGAFFSYFFPTFGGSFFGHDSIVDMLVDRYGRPVIAAAKPNFNNTGTEIEIWGAYNTNSVSDNTMRRYTSTGSFNSAEGFDMEYHEGLDLYTYFAYSSGGSMRVERVQGGQNISGLVMSPWISDVASFDLAMSDPFEVTPYFNKPIVAYVQASDNKLKVVYTENRGPTINDLYMFSIGQTNFVRALGEKNSQIEAKWNDGKIYVAYIDLDAGNKVSVVYYDGNLWQHLGSTGFGEVAADNVHIEFDGDNTPYVSYSTANSTETHIYRFINNNWEPLHPFFKSEITSGTANPYSDIALDGESVFLFAQDSGKVKLSKYELWEDLVGETSDPLVISNVTKAMDGKRIRCEFGTGCDTEVSGFGYIYVDSNATIVSVQGDKWPTQGPGILNLSAQPNFGSVDWYDSDTNYITTSLTYETPLLDSTTTYLVRAADGQCSGDMNFTPVLAEIPYPALDYPIDSTALFNYQDSICPLDQTVISFNHGWGQKTMELFSKGTTSSWEKIEGPTTAPFFFLRPDTTAEYRVKLFNDGFGFNSYNAGGISYTPEGCSSCGVEELAFKPSEDPNKEITIEAWVYIKNASGSTLSPFNALSLTSDNPTGSVSTVLGPISWYQGDFHVLNYTPGVGGGSRQTGFPAFPNANEWLHIATVADSNSLRIYYNGQLVKEQISSSSRPIMAFGTDSTTSIRIAATPHLENIDEVRIWKSARTAEQIRGDMINCQDTSDADLIFYNDFSQVQRRSGSIPEGYKKDKGSAMVINNPLSFSGRQIIRENSGCEVPQANVFYTDSFTITVLDEPYIIDYQDRYESPNDSACGIDSIQAIARASAGDVYWYSDPEGTALVHVGDTFSIELEKDTVFYIGTNSTTCNVNEVEFRVNVVPTTFYAKTDSICIGDRFRGGEFEDDIEGGVEGFGYFASADPSDTTLIYGDSWDDIKNGGSGGGEPEFSFGGGSSLPDYYVNQIDTLWVEAYGQYCKSDRVPFIIYPLESKVTRISADQVICQPDSIELFIEWTGGTMEYYDGDDYYDVPASGRVMTPLITETTTFEFYFNDECDADETYFEVTVHYGSMTTEVDTIVNCDNFTWLGTTYYQSGIYYDSLLSSRGCDSIIQLNLTLDQGVQSEEFARITCGDYIWNGITYNSPGVYYDTLTNSIGCDSIIQLTLEYYNEPELTYDELVCPNTTADISVLNSVPAFTYSLYNDANSLLYGPVAGNGSTLTYTTSNLTADEAYYWRVDSDTLLNLGTGSSIQLDGSSISRIDCGNDPSVQITGNQITLMAWINPKQFRNNPHEAHIISKETNSPDYGYMLRCGGNGQINFNAGNGSWNELTTPNQVLELDKWQHVAATYDGSTIRIFVNGIEVHSDSRTFTIGNSNHNLAIGSYPTGGSAFNGQIDEVKVWNVARTPAQISSDMLLESDGSESGLVAYYNFEEGIGGTAFDLAGNNDAQFINLDTISTWQTGIGSAYNNCTTSNTSTFAVEVISSGYNLDTTVCGSYSIGTSTYFQSGIYSDTLLSSVGCDSIVVSDVTVLQSSADTLQITSCDSYNWNGTDYTASGIYRDTLTNSLGCDSLILLNLTIDNSTTGTTVIQQTACGSFRWNLNNITYTNSGLYSVALNNSSGCDSIVQLDLTINQRSFSSSSVTACDQYIWTLTGLTYTSSGQYQDTLQNQAGCDSIVRLNLTINPSTSSMSTITACNSYTWSVNNQTYTSTGIYTETFTQSNGCDSTFTLDLTINSTFFSTETITACDSYTWMVNNQTYFSSGIYRDTLSTTNGCDSIVSLDLTINFSASSTETVSACDSYTWSVNNQTYSTTGIYRDTLSTVNGCDSVVTLDLTINFSASSTETVSACDSYTWTVNNQTYSTSGMYVDTLSTTNGCDSVVTLDLTINNSASSTESITACDSYTWSVNSQTYTMSGMYMDTLSTVNSCDSVVTLNLTINNSASSTESITACDSYTWSVNNQTYSTTGIYRDTLSTVNGCDSVVTLDLTINFSASTTETASACDAYTWSANSQSYTASGMYTATLSTANGCDSVVTLDLTINNSAASTESVTACDSYTWSVNNQTYTMTGMYIDTLSTVNGCDSVVTLDLTINNSASSTESITACDSYTWVVNNQTYSTSGIYRDTLSTINGCDSIVSLDLTINFSAATIETVSACDAYTWSVNNQTYSTSGMYMDTLSTVNGCDSIVTLDLTINPSASSTESISACDSYVWSVNNQTYSTSGIYIDTLSTTNGCDSIVTLDLTINPSASSTESITACDSYTWMVNNQTYSTSGIYRDTLSTINGCDSIVSLDLTINFSAATTEIVSTCDAYTWSVNNQTYSTSGMYVDTLSTANGCDSIVTLDLTINPSASSTESISACDSYTWSVNNQTYSVSGMYVDTLSTINGCDSIVTMDLTINPSISLSTAITACDSFTWPVNNQTYATSGIYRDTLSTVNGCDSIEILDLTINNSTLDSIIVGTCNPYVWQGDTIFQSGIYNDTLVSSSGCDSILVLDLSFGTNATTTTNIIACDSYTWRGNIYTQSATYTDTVPSTQGCDTIHTLNLTINPSTSSSTAITACDSYLWNGNVFTQSGTYFDTIPNSVGCDSAMTLVLTINPSTSSLNTITACDSYTWQGNSYTNSGIYSDTILNSVGCDSILSLDLTILNSTSTIDSVSSCDSYTWRGNSFTQSGLYYDTLINSAGCDSILILDLSIRNTTSDTLNISACDPYPWLGDTLFSSGTYIDTISNLAGCDSIITLNFTLGNRASFTSTINACDSFDWRGTNYTQSGVYTDTVLSSIGCDTIYVLDLTINLSASSADTIIACDSFIWSANNATYTSSGVYVDTLSTVNGCDSVVTLDLTINNSASSTESITACDSYTWMVNNQTYSTSGFYVDTLSTTNGCDSLVTLDLTINNSASSTEIITACDSYTWTVNNQTYSTSGMYMDTLSTTNGCDSVVTLDLTINLSASSTETITACDAYTWSVNNQTYSTSGMYMDTLSTVNGCDSVVTLDLTINPSASSTESVTACDSYTWSVNNQTYSTSGMYVDTLSTTNGCDSVVTLDLTINLSVSNRDTVSACDSYTWSVNNQTYTTSGIYIDSLSTINGCDSIEILDLTINNSTVDSTAIGSCGPYVWQGDTLAQSGIYRDTLVSSAGCDSLLILDLSIGTTAMINENITACDSYNWRGTVYAQSGTYTDTITSTQACDTIFTLNLTINLSTMSSDTVQACDSYQWNGNLLTQSGIYRDTIINANGCDSTITLVLSIDQSTSIADTVQSCGSYLWQGVSYTASGTYFDTIPNSVGCDSILSLELTILNTTTTVDSISSCDSYTWLGMNYTQSGVYTDTLVNSVGCDSILILDLTIQRSTSETLTIGTCEPYPWLGDTLFQSGTYIDTIANNAGCDSIITLNFTLGNTASLSTTVNSCGDYIWRGNTYSQSGIYTDTIVSSQACDTILILDLTINNSVMTLDTITACDAYTWSANSITYTNSGIYTDTLSTANGCDSIVTIDLTINNSVSRTDTVTACDSYTWLANNQSYSATGVYIDTLNTANGCDSILTLDLTIINSISTVDSVVACNSYTWAYNGMTYSTSGIYSDTLASQNGCDSLITLDLTINSVTDTTTSFDGITITANNSNASYQWLDCDSNFAAIVGETAQSFVPTIAGSYAVELTENGCVDTSACVAVVGIVENTFAIEPKLFPNPTERSFTIDLGSVHSNTQVIISELSGKVISTTNYEARQIIELELVEASGIYFVKVVSDEKTAIMKLMLKR